MPIGHGRFSWGLNPTPTDNVADEMRLGAILSVGSWTPPWDDRWLPTS